MRLLASLVLLLAATYEHQSLAFTPSSISIGRHHSSSSSNTALLVKKQSRSTLIIPANDKKNKSSSSTPTVTKKKKEEEEEEGEIYGAKFFGGSAIKEELFDAELEEKADRLSKLYPKKKKTVVATTKNDDDLDDDDDDLFVYRRFQDKVAFPDDVARNIAQRLQTAMNQALYEPEDDDDEAIPPNPLPLYSPSLKWDTPFSRTSKTNMNPLEELTNALDFYKRVDAVILSAKNTSDQAMEIRWEISLVWPNVFESRVLLTGTSQLQLESSTNDNNTIITKQVDSLDNGGSDGQDIIQAISQQIQPRFWDLYHVGMTPSTEQMPRLKPSSTTTTNKVGAFASYRVTEIPPRLVSKPSIIDQGGRKYREAQAIPNHAFTSSIKTTGPQQQRYVTASPVQVTIKRTKDGQSRIEWSIPTPAEFVSYSDDLPLPILTNEEDGSSSSSNPLCSYEYQPRRLIATLPFGGNPQDEGVTEIRKALYEQVMKDGWKIKLDEEEGGRPQFFFLQNDAKACFTADGGLGMAVYEWRADFAKSNEIGIELEY